MIGACSKHWGKEDIHIKFQNENVVYGTHWRVLHVEGRHCYFYIFIIYLASLSLAQTL
jgi:hypothetical protein